MGQFDPKICLWLEDKERKIETWDELSEKRIRILLKKIRIK